MKIAYYCQHVLGVGHFHRSLEICRACSTEHEITMILGGPPVEMTEPALRILQLPGLRMDERFSGLIPCDPTRELETVKQERRERLLDYISENSPDCLIIELFPFGRKAFRFELEPLLERLQANSSTRIYCSLRDILVEKTEGLEKFEKRVVATLNRYFDALLVHADMRFVRLEQTFSRMDEVQVPVHYTGYVTPHPLPDARQRLRAGIGLGRDQRLVVASIGSGSVGHDLLDSVARATGHLPGRSDWSVHLFGGPYLDRDVFESLCSRQDSVLRVHEFTENFVDWLAAADLSISMAGYNTSMNTLAAGVPALLYPFSQNREQSMRTQRLAAAGPLKLLERGDLVAERLAHLMVDYAGRDRYTPEIDLDGGVRTRELIERLDRQ
jgi:predicted glycosyltransferase